MKMRLQRMLVNLGVSLTLGAALPAALAHGAGPVDPCAQEQEAAAQDAPDEVRVYATTRPAPDVVKLGLRIQDAALQIKLGTNLKQTEKALNQIWLELATSEPYMQQASTLAALALVRASCYMKMQDFEAARAAAQTSFLTDAHPLVRQKINRFRGVSEEQLRQASEHRNSLVPLKELALKMRVSGYLEGQQLARIVGEAYEAGDFGRLIQIGLVGYDALEELILRDIDVFPSKGQDPLRTLVGISFERSGRFVSKNFHKGGNLWRRRVFLVLDHYANSVLRGSSLYDNSIEVTPDYPAWIEVAAKLVATPGIAEDAVKMASARLYYGPGYRPLLKALVAAAKVHGEDFLTTIFKTVHRNVTMDPLLLDAGARSEFESVRISVGKRLMPGRLPIQLNSIELLALDPVVEVRNSVFGVINAWAQSGKVPDSLLLRLTHDSDPELRSYAVDNLKYIEGSIPDEDWRRLVKDPEVMVRRSMTWLLVDRLGQVNQALAEELVLSLAYEVDAELSNTVNYGLLDRKNVVDHPAVRVGLRQRLERDEPLKLEASSYNPFELEASFIEVLSRSRSATQEIAEWLLSANDEVFLRIFDRMHRSPFSLYLVSPDLTPDQREALIVRAESSGRIVARNIRTGVSSTDANISAIEMATHNLAAPRAVRLSCALGLVLLKRGLGRNEAAINRLRTEEGLQECLLALLVAPAWHESDPTDSEVQMLAELLDKMDRGDCNALVLAALQSNALPEWLAVQLARATHHSSDNFEGLVMPILDRWFDPKKSSPQVKLALRGAYRLGKQAPRDVLMRALEQPEYVQLAVNSMCNLQAPEFTEVIGEYLTGKRSVDRQKVAAPSPERMVSSLASVGSDAAVGYLLEALSSDSTNVQILSAEALDLIEARRNRLVRWEDGLSHGPSRAEALNQLLILLQDESPTARALAVRGVGAFGAVEYIPTLIGMLKDPAQEVREAVVDAVKQLSSIPAPRQIDATLPLDAQKKAADK